jgi:4-alpha-glucanotransferase
MPPFAAYWRAEDLPDLQDLGLFNDEEVLAEQQTRQRIRAGLIEFLRRTGDLEADQDSLEAMLDALLRWLAGSRAAHVLVSLEDLWYEVLPQNTPGTYEERPNWRRKLRYSLETLRAEPRFRELLTQVTDRRRSE